MAEEWGVDPVGEEEEWGVDPVSSEVPASLASTPIEKPSVGDYVWRGVKAGAKYAGQVAAEPFQLGYEAVVAPLSGAYRTAWNVASYLPAVAGGMAGGASLGDAAQQARPVLEENRQRGLPATLGKGSWLGRGIGAGVNALAQADAVRLGLMQGMSFQEAMARAKQENVLTALGPEGADLLALTGVPALRRGAARIGPAIKNLKGVIPTAAERAGERWSKARNTLPTDTPQGAAEFDRIMADRVETGNAMRELGVERMPYRTDPSYGVQQLARERARGGGKVYTSEAELEAIARKQAGEGLEKIVPSESIDPARLSFINQKLEAHNQAQKAAAEAGKVAGKEATAVTTAEAAMAELNKLEAAVPPKTPFDKTGFGSRLLNRLRGKTEGETATGVEAVRKVFNEEYGKFDSRPEAVASSESLLDALDNARESSVESGQILKNYVDEGGKITNRLGKDVETPVVGGEVESKFSLPETLTLKQWRGIKDEFAKAAIDATKTDRPRAAKELWALADAAKKGEMEAVAALGKKAVSGYQALSKSYDDVMLRAFRRGLGGKLLAPGDTALKSKFTEEGITASVVKSPSNARDLVAALGAEKAAMIGKPVVGLTEAGLRELGLPEAQKLVRPLVESELAELYARKGGGKRGADAVLKYLADKNDTLSVYGLDFNGLRKAATQYNEAMARLTGSKTSVARGVVAEVLTTDPAKVGGYVLDSPNPAAAYKNMIGVSKDPAWKSSIDTLIKDELKARIDDGEDVFGNAKTRAAMEQVFTPTQVRALSAYHTIIKKLNESPASFDGAGLSPHPGEVLVGAAQALPVGMTGFAYVAKYLGKFAAKLGLKASDDAVLSYLDEAHINPAKAREIVAAYKGSRLARNEMMKGIEKERSAMKTLKGMTQQAIPGAAATGIRNEAEESSD